MQYYLLAILKCFHCLSTLHGRFEFRSARRSRNRNRNRRRAAAHENSDSFTLLESGSRAARLRLSIDRAVLTAAFVIVLSAPALAQEQSHPALGDPAATRIEIDEQANVIRFIVDGQEAMRLDAAGLHVRNDIDYGGALTDYGQTGFDAQAAKAAEGRDAP